MPGTVQILSAWHLAVWRCQAPRNFWVPGTSGTFPLPTATRPDEKRCYDATAMADPHDAASIPAPAKPLAQKMASDDVLAVLQRGEAFFLDVRDPRELAELGTFDGYVNIPFPQLEKRLHEIPKDKPIITA